MKCYFHFPTSKTAGIFLRRQQGSSSRERCVAGVLRRFKVFSPFFFFLVGGFSFTPNTHSYCSQIKQNHAIIVGSSKLLLIQIIVIYRQTTQSRFLVWHMSSVVSRAMNKWGEIKAKVWRAGQRNLEQEKRFLQSTFLQGARGQDCVIQQCHLVHHAPQTHPLRDKIH